MKHGCKLLGLGLAVLAMACQGRNIPEGVLDHDQMVGFLCEAYLMEGYYSVATRYAYDSLPPSLEGAYAALLDSLGVTREQVEQSFTYYAAHPEAYVPIQEEVSVRLDTLR